ncbi:MAG: hypothetical protein KDA68_19700 [Planctomycetaceae bacterium]|nr:hypothetical protein [Planctomycetaceae bacterium]
MVDVPCKVTGKYLDDTIPPYDSVFGEISEITVYSKDGEPIPIDVASLQELSANELDDLQYLERRCLDKTEFEEFRQKLLSRRQEW